MILTYHITIPISVWRTIVFHKHIQIDYSGIAHQYGLQQNHHSNGNAQVPEKTIVLPGETNKETEPYKIENSDRNRKSIAYITRTYVEA